jgi:ribonuclease P protein component
MEQHPSINLPDRSLPAEERIKSRKLFDQLFESGQSFGQGTLRVVWMEIPFTEKNPVQVGFSVPKRRMRKANKRNRMKRLMKEAYRLNKTGLIQSAVNRKRGMAVLFIAQVNAPLAFPQTQDKIILLLQRLIRVNAPLAE